MGGSVVGGGFVGRGAGFFFLIVGGLPGGGGGGGGGGRALLVAGTKQGSRVAAVGVVVRIGRLDESGSEASFDVRNTPVGGPDVRGISDHGSPRGNWGEEIDGATHGGLVNGVKVITGF